MAVVDQGRLIDMAGLDDSINNTRVRATKTPITVGAITFPSNPMGTNYIEGAGTPISITSNAAQTLTAERLLTGIITISTSTGLTATFDTAANIVAGVNLVTAGAVVGDYITTLICSGGASTVTLAAGSGGSFDTAQASRTITTGTSKYVWVRLTNVTPGSEAYVIYF